MGWIVAPNMDKLRDQIADRWPGVVIGTIGDLAHAAGTSGHNPDDTAGVKAELSDGDSLQEVRALDPMISSHFTAADAAELVRILTTVPACRARLYYVIYNRRICSRSHGWVWRPYTGSDPHTGHVHLSGWAADDANATPWPIDEEDDVSTQDVTEGLATTVDWESAGVSNWAASTGQGRVSARALLEYTYAKVAQLEAKVGAPAELDYERLARAILKVAAGA